MSGISMKLYGENNNFPVPWKNTLRAEAAKLCF